MKPSIILVIIILILLTACQSAMPLTTAQPHRVYIPALMYNYPPPLFGIELEGATNLEAYYRGDIIKVSHHMDRPLDLLLTKLAGYDDGPVFLSLKGAKTWWVTPTCKPVPELFWDGWTTEAITAIRLTGADIVEIGNEPATDETFYEMFFGCWGTTYANGVYYGRFVSHVSGILHLEFPELIMLGGAFAHDPGDFSRGFADTVSNIDGVSFHGHTYCNTDYKTGLTTRRDAYRATFQALPLYLSETSMIFAEYSAECEQQQADFAEWLLTDFSGVQVIIWYTLCDNAWLNSDLCKKLAWDVYESEMMR